MRKEESLEVKGIAILLMLLLHLFNTQERVGECVTFLNFWSGKPLVFALSRIGSFCVPLYIFLSGYGLFTIYRERHALAAGRRLVSLYLNYWTVFAVFVPLACVLVPSVYPGSAAEFFLNLFALDCGYNHEWWFFRPYVLLLLSATLIFRCLEKSGRNCRVAVALSLAGFFAAYAFRHAGDPFLRVAVEFLNLLFMFVCGAVYARNDVFGRVRAKVDGWICGKREGSRGRGVRRLFPFLALFALLLLRMSLGPSFLSVFFVLVALPLYIALSRPLWLKGLLCFFGRHSTNIWLTHTFFAYYLFHPYVYGLKYPLLMYAALLSVSLAASFLIGFLYKPVRRYALSRMRQDPRPAVLSEAQRRGGLPGSGSQNAS